MPDTLTPEDWDLLLGRIKSGKCTPFLGAGANYPILSSGTAIARRWAEDYHYPLADASDLARVAQYLAIRRRDAMWPKEKILAVLDEECGRSDLDNELRAPASILGVLAALPLPVYITTNYDDFMFRALALHGKQPRIELCRWNELLLRRQKSLFDRKCGFIPSVQQPLVFHLHGHRSVVESLVLTEDDYLDFLISVSRQDDLLPAVIQEAVTGTSLLFIGYRLADLNFRVLFRGLVNSMEGSLRRINVAVQLPPGEVPASERPNAQAYLDQYFDKVQVRVFWDTAEEFARQLRTRWEALPK